MIMTIEQRLMFLEERCANLEERMRQREADDLIARETINLMLDAMKKRSILQEV